jgi:outer membrane protein TolC
VNRKNAISTNFSSGIALDWTLFDGMKMFATKDKLAELEARGKVNLKMEMENTVSQLITLYFDVVRIQQLIKAINESLNISTEREKLAQKKLDIGSGSKLELLQAKVDLNAQKSALLKLEIERQNSTVALNQLLSKGSSETYYVEDSITINDALVLTSVQQAALSNNSALFYAQHNIAIANYSLKEYKSNSLPQVGVTLNYNFSRTQNQVGLVLLNQNQGLNTGLYASWTLFNGFQNHTQINIAKYNIDQSQLYLKQTSSLVDASLLKSWNSYQGAISILKLEEENISVARENINIALERFRLGTSNNIELMFAQKSYEDAIGRLYTARYDAKLAETELLRLQGQLVK